jgi:pimeloyl-ACP methyl ester carboxylesterase
MRMRPSFPSVALGGTALLLVLLVGAGPAPAETEVRGDLPRRGWLGASFQGGPEGRPIVGAVTPDSPAAEAGLAPGDVVLRVGTVPTQVPGALPRAMTGLRAGDPLPFLVSREDEKVELTVTLGPAPFEPADGFDLVYDLVEAEDARLRTILTRPPGDGPFPAVLFVQGLQCGSIEQPFGPPSVVLQLIHRFTRAGWVVMRVEKSGIGDSTGEPCSEIGFHTELAGYRAALEALGGYDFVDAENVFVFGHSLGGLQAPMLAAKHPVRGIMVYGTGILPWAEYLVENARRQGRLDPDLDRTDLEDTLRARQLFYHYLLRENLSPYEAAEKYDYLQDIAKEDIPDGTHMYTRHVDFFRELDRVCHAEWWAKAEAPVLAMYGEYDFTTDFAAHEYIAEIVNQKRPGTARAVQLPGLFHAFNERASMEETLADPWSGPLSDEMVELCLGWMRGVMEQGKGS